MNKDFDVIVIGATSAGYISSYKLAKEGKRVALVDFHEYGGSSVKGYCDSKKYLIEAASINHSLNHLLGSGIDGFSKIDWNKLVFNKNEFLDSDFKKIIELFKKENIEILNGYTEFVDKDSLSVDEKIYRADKYIIASGNRPKKLFIDGNTHIKSWDDFISLEWLPKSIVFIGGGIISFELAHIAKQAGSKVTIAHRNQTYLKNFEQDLVKDLIESSKKDGIRFVDDFEIKKIKESQNGYRLVSTSNQVLEAQMVFQAIGTTPNIEDLNLDIVGVNVNERGIVVNSHMQTSNPNIYAVGDVVDSLMLAMVTDIEVNVAVRNILNDLEKEIDYSIVPTTIFTLPPLSSIGKTQKELDENSIEYTIRYEQTQNWLSSKSINQKHSSFKIYLDKDDFILGAHILGHNSSEIINIFLMAMKYNIKAKDLTEVFWSYPTNISDIKSMLEVS